MAGSGRAFWSLVRREHRSVTVSRAVLVDGGLSPPPSKIYPGTRCYMVTVAVDNKEHCGFGPSPSIAQRAAILEAYRFLRSRKDLNTRSKFVAGEEGSDSEGEDFHFQATQRPDNESLLHRVAHHHGNVDDTVCSSPHHHCEDTKGLSRPMVHHNNDLARLSMVQPRLSRPPVNHHEGVEYPPLNRYSERSVVHCTADADNVLDSLLDMAQRKSVDIKFEFLFFTTEVVALVLGGGLSFVGKHQEKHLAGREAAVKMLEALEKWPDPPPIQMMPIKQFQGPPYGLPLPLVPWAHPSHPPCFPNYPPSVPCAIPAPQNGFRPPFLPPLLPYSPEFPNHSTPFHPPLDHTRSQYFRPCPPPQINPSGGGESSSECGDGDSQQLSHGLSEVLPSRGKAHRTEKVISVKETPVSKCAPPLERSERKSPFGKNLPFSVVSPFESSSPYSDPFQFTVRLPRSHNCLRSEKPPWKKIRSSVNTSLPPAAGVRQISLRNTDAEFSPREKQEVARRPKEKQEVARRPKEKDLPVATGSPAVESMPAHFLLPVGKVESSPCEENSLPAHFLLPIAEYPETKSLPTHFLLQEESLSPHNGGQGDLPLDSRCAEAKPSSGQDIEASLPDKGCDLGITGQDMARDEGQSEELSGQETAQDDRQSGQDKVQDKRLSGQDRGLSGHDRAQDRGLSGQDKAQDRGLSGQDKIQDMQLSGLDEGPSRWDKAQNKELDKAQDEGPSGRDKAQDKRLSGQDKAQDKGLSGLDKDQDKQLSGQDEVQDRGLSGRDEVQDKQLSGRDEVQDKQLCGRDEVQDKQLSGRDMVQDKQLSGRDEVQDKQLSGRDMVQDKQLDMVQDKQLSGRDNDQEKGVSGRDMVQDKGVSGQDMSRDKGLSGQDKGQDRGLSGHGKGLFGSFSFASAQDRVSRMISGEVCIGMPTEGPCNA